MSGHGQAGQKTILCDQMITVLILAGSFFTGCAIVFVIGVLRQGDEE